MSDPEQNASIDPKAPPGLLGRLVRRLVAVVTRRKHDVPVYPIVKCGKGHKAEPGYIVCDGVLNRRKPVGQFIAATEKDLGQILCADGNHVDVESAELVCAQCARERGWIPEPPNDQAQPRGSAT